MLLSKRNVFLLPVLAAVVALNVASCSQSSKHRILTFFFEGVPDQGAAAETVEESASLPEDDGSPRAFERPELVKPKFYWHPPYRNNRCNECHDVYQGKLIKKPEEGLCISCHTDPPGDREFVHGPVAANACLMCHHQHMSPNPRMLLAEVKSICFRCHQLDDLLVGKKHHAVLGAEAPPVCIECHDPHGGNNRFFLK